MLGPVAFHEGKPQLCKIGCNGAGYTGISCLLSGGGGLVAGAMTGVALHSAGLSPVGYALGVTGTGVAGPMLLIACGVAATVAVAAIDQTEFTTFTWGMAGFTAGGTAGSLFGDGINAVVSSLFF